MTDPDSATNAMRDYPNALAAAQLAAMAGHLLLRAAREDDAIPISEVLTCLVDAARCVAEIEHRDEDGQLIAALHKWLDEVGDEVIDV